MERSVVSTDQAPGAIGPYSQGIKTSGTIIFCAGQVALDPESGQIVGETVGEQTHLALKNVKAVLRAAGADLSNVVKSTVFLESMSDFADMNEAYAQYFPNDPPARSAVGGLQLPKGAKVEIECIAVV